MKVWYWWCELISSSQVTYVHSYTYKYFSIMYFETPLPPNQFLAVMITLASYSCSYLGLIGTLIIDSVYVL